MGSSDYRKLMKAKKELKDSKAAADEVAVRLQQAIDPDAPFTLCGNLKNVLIQIDNMVSRVLKASNGHPPFSI